MKKVLFVILLITSVSIVEGQQWYGSSDVNGNINRYGNIGIGENNPKGILHAKSGSLLYNSINTQYDANIIIEATNSSRTIGQGAALGFVVPANTDGTNPWQQGRILVTPDNTSNYNASGRMYIQTRYSKSGAWHWNNNIVLTSSGNVGIGTINPNVPLEISHTGNKTSALWLNDESDPSSTTGIYLRSTTEGRISTAGVLTFYTGGDIGTERIRLTSNGNLLIGKTSQQNSNYKLNVAGSIRANEIKVNLDGADFVFEPNYKLKPLNEVESYIKENKRLPEIASADEMSKEGADLGELNTKLLQKIEELTLYMIGQNKRIEKLEKENELLKIKTSIYQ